MEISLNLLHKSGGRRKSYTTWPKSQTKSVTEVGIKSMYSASQVRLHRLFSHCKILFLFILRRTWCCSSLYQFELAQSAPHYQAVNNNYFGKHWIFPVSLGNTTLHFTGYLFDLESQATHSLSPEHETSLGFEVSNSSGHPYLFILKELQ